MEIVSLVGTLAAKGGPHLHISVANSQGQTIGGHLMEGNSIYTTAEVVLGNANNLLFVRELDPQSGYEELVVECNP